MLSHAWNGIRFTEPRPARRGLGGMTRQEVPEGRKKNVAATLGEVEATPEGWEEEGLDTLPKNRC